MAKLEGIDILFVAGFGPVSHDHDASTKLYRETLGIPFKEENNYLHTDQLEGVKQFAIWPLSQAAQSCFGTTEWPGDLPVPQAWLEFDVADVDAATVALEAQGYKPLVAAREEPWGQT
ncbi:MAG: glyoxalase, partial [Chloroflexi bacterium]|nr:glyoxalase [Chloroflexota bacterium]